MTYSHIRKTDLNSLFALSVLLEERHISRAAERCFVSQSAMSRIFSRLRNDFSDDLLIRSGRAYELTPKAERLQAELSKLLPFIESFISGEGYDPLLLQEQIRLTMNDHSCAILLPHIMKQINASAPHIKVVVRDFSDRRFEEIRQGRTDLLLDVSGGPRDLESETLYTEDFVCVVSKDHPAVSETMDMERYLAFSHVVVNVLEGQQTLIDRMLGDRTLQRQVGLVIPYFSSAMFTVCNSDMILTAPKRLALLLERSADVRIIPAPPELKPFAYQMIWHKRSNEDPVQSWLRDQVRASVVKAARFPEN